jgi:hypothetical protein
VLWRKSRLVTMLLGQQPAAIISCEVQGSLPTLDHRVKRRRAAPSSVGNGRGRVPREPARLAVQSG